MELKCKTRGNSTPNGKGKVYFSCHPDDIALLDHYFRLISDKYNIAMYYTAGTDRTTETEKDILSLLEDMSLFVVPVTENYLFKANFARLSELPFALENNIPVLPVVQQSGIISEFNEICGSLQCLNENDQDLTAIPFSEKLTQRLNAVLLNDETAQKVQDAFDAWVFLSYRKKDRRLARDLMSLIHRNEYCRDIAIWYDEYLVPGEAFDDAIEHALAKSGLFALLVTPNLVNEDNYVMNIEYPLAREKNKPILPLEGVSVNLSQLREKYPDIPDCVSAWDDAKVVSELQKRLKIAATEKSSSPEHNYLIGLAYLNGLHVEKDATIAASMIRAAAEAKLPEAIKQMGNMFYSGNGVERDHNTAIRWYEEYLQIQKLDKNHDKKEIHNGQLFSVRNMLAQLYEETGQSGEAERLHRKTIEDIEALGKSERKVYHRALAMAKHYLADFLFTQNRESEAYKEALDARQHLKGFTLNMNVTEQFFDIDLLIGRILISTGKASEAEPYYRECYEYSRKLSNEDPVRFEEKFARACRSLGNLYSELNRVMDAEKYLKESCEIYRRRYEEQRDKISPWPLTESVLSLAAFFNKQNRSEEAEPLYEEALQFQREMAAEYPERYEDDLMKGCHSLGLFYRMQHKPEKAEKLIRESLSIAEKLALKNYKQFSPSLADIWQSLGIILAESGKKEEAQTAFLRVLEIRKESADRTPDNIDAVINIARILNNIAFNYQSSEEYEKANEYYRRSLAYLHGTESADLDFRLLTARTNGLAGANCFYQKNMEESEGFLKKAYDLWKELYEENPDAYSQELAKIISNLGYLYVNTGRIAEGKIFYKEAGVILEENYKSDPDRFREDMEQYKKNLKELEDLESSQA